MVTPNPLSFVLEALAFPRKRFHKPAIGTLIYGAISVVGPLFSVSKLNNFQTSPRTQTAIPFMADSKI